ncbi:LOW QUALITY PROTEIN: X-ray repair cross-complementing protein 6 [Panulirus ornatus]|uniref:LOW QUALITY PROTEIN: X-ray repair cross-complementing protein 6 n=1 Tax=Panulirus ornatus TaxID=150431 RepID=UPI003A86AC34
MDDWKFDGTEDSEGEEDSEGSSWFDGGRTATVFLIDAAEEMFKAQEEDTGEGEEAPFHRAMRAAHATLMRKIISNNQDLLSVVLFNTRETKNPIDFAHVYILQELERSGAENVLMLEKLIEMDGNRFDVKYGRNTNASLQDALRVCQTVFNKCTNRLSGQSILLFTCRDDPHAGDDQKKRQARRKVQDLKEAGIVLEILHMGETFDVKKFYKDLIIPDESEDDEDSQEKITLADPTSRFDELMERVRRLDHKQRTTGRVLFTLAPGVEMSVGVYTAVRKMNKPSKVNLWKNTNEELRYMKKEYLEETGEILVPSDYVKYQTYGGRKIKFTLDEVRSMARIHDPEIKLLGFKPISSIKPYYHVRPGNFIYPDEKSVQGSKKMFAALLERCLARKMAAIVRLVTRKGASVSWAALIPQKEELDRKNCQVTPPGFIACHLPFADDFRNIQIENTIRATPDQVDAAKAVIKKLHFKYSPDSFDNPDIQTHWRNIEALALNRSHLEPVPDYTVPDYERMQKKAGMFLQKFQDLVYPPSYDPNESVKKRPAPKSTPAPKRAKPDPGSIDVEAMAKAGKADKLTMDILKAWLQERGVKVSGKKKAQLVQDVMDEVEV